MTTPDPPPMADAPDDEVVSAYLDGEATPDEAARVESDPALQARLGEMRAVVRAVAGPLPPVAADAREALIARVLAAAAEDRPAPVTTPAAPPAKVVDFEAARARRERFRRGIRIASIAAAVAAILALPVLAGLGDSGDSEGDAAAPTLENFAEEADESGGAAAGLAADEAAPVVHAGDLGSFDDERELGTELARRAESAPAARAEDVQDQSTEAYEDSGGDSAAAPLVAEGLADQALQRCQARDGAPLVTGHAVLNGDPVAVALYPAGAGTYDLVVVRYVNDTCRVDVVDSVSAPED